MSQGPAVVSTSSANRYRHRTRAIHGRLVVAICLLPALVIPVAAYAPGSDGLVDWLVVLLVVAPLVAPRLAGWIEYVSLTPEAVRVQAHTRAIQYGFESGAQVDHEVRGALGSTVNGVRWLVVTTGPATDRRASDILWIDDRNDTARLDEVLGFGHAHPGTLTFRVCTRESSRIWLRLAPVAVTALMAFADLYYGNLLLLPVWLLCVFLSWVGLVGEARRHRELVVDDEGMDLATGDKRLFCEGWQTEIVGDELRVWSGRWDPPSRRALRLRVDGSRVPKPHMLAVMKAAIDLRASGDAPARHAAHVPQARRLPLPR
jgi:hypothetical protein